MTVLLRPNARQPQRCRAAAVPSFHRRELGRLRLRRGRVDDNGAIVPNLLERQDGLLGRHSGYCCVSGLTSVSEAHELVARRRPTGRARSCKAAGSSASRNRLSSRRRLRLRHLWLGCRALYRAGRLLPDQGLGRRRDACRWKCSRMGQAYWCRSSRFARSPTNRTEFQCSETNQENSARHFALVAET